MSWKPEVIADSTGKWCGNGLRFATHQEAQANALNLAMRWTAVRAIRAVESDDPVNALNLAMRWTAVRDTRVVECDDPVNYRWTDAGLERVEG
jgi:hypothetical protein